MSKFGGTICDNSTRDETVSGYGCGWSCESAYWFKNARGMWDRVMARLCVRTVLPLIVHISSTLPSRPRLDRAGTIRIHMYTYVCQKSTIMEANF